MYPHCLFISTADTYFIDFQLLADTNIYITIPMQTTHLLTKEELLISNRFDWYGLKEKAYKKKSAHSQQSENFLSLRIR